MNIKKTKNFFAKRNAELNVNSSGLIESSGLIGKKWGFVRKAAKVCLFCGLFVSLQSENASGIGVPPPDCFPDDLDDKEGIISQAKSGNASAINEWGLLFYLGKGCDQDFKKACELFESGANKGNREAMNNLGCCYYAGQGVPQSYEKAVEFWTMSENKGMSKARLNLAICYLKGIGCEKNCEKAIDLLTKAAEKHSVAMFTLGMYYYDGKEVQKDLQKAFEWFAKGAKDCNSKAYYWKGLMLFKGEAPYQDDKEAFNCYHAAACKGIIEAMYDVAICYLQGKGVEKDCENAFLWFEDAANKGEHAYATYYQGLSYYQGEVVKQNYTKAFNCYIKAGSHGVPEAMRNAAICYLQGKGVEKDYENAIVWFKLAAKKGHPVIDLDFPNCTDNDLKCIAKLTSLQTLSLSLSSITDKGLKNLESLVNLKKLHLKNCDKITDAGKEMLKNAIPDLIISIE